MFLCGFDYRSADRIDFCRCAAQDILQHRRMIRCCFPRNLFGGGPDQDSGQGKARGEGNVGPADKPEDPTDEPEARADTP